METPKSDAKLSTASEYALIFGAGASAAVSLAAQQVAAASVPVAALVAIGLMNRRRLDQQVNESEQPLGPQAQQHTSRQPDVAPGQVTSRPMPAAIAVQLGSVSPAMSRPVLGYSDRLRSRHHAQAQYLAHQTECLKAIGAQLKQVREDQGWSLQDIYERTFVQRHALRAIELGDVSALPEPFYIRAFVQKYAIALGLPGTEIAARFPNG